MADNHWRNTMRPARFFMFDARAAFPFLLVLVHFRVYTLVLAALLMLVFWIVEQRGYTFEAALRWFRAFMIAPNRPAVPKIVLRRGTDYMEKVWFLEEAEKVSQAKGKKGAKALPGKKPSMPVKRKITK